MAGDDVEERGEGVSRRTLLKAIAAGAAVGVAATVTATRLMPPFPARLAGEGFVYVRGGDVPNPYGFDDLVGQSARVGHFTEVWSGAPTLWRAARDADGVVVPGTGFPALLLRVDPSLLTRPPEWLPGRDFIDNPAIVAIWDRCTHLCCFPQWHPAPLPPVYQDYEAGREPRTYLAGQDPIWCRCHDAQFDPVTLEWDRHPAGTLYVAARWSHGPATRGLPMISIEDRNGEIVGAEFDAVPPLAPSVIVNRLGGRNASAFREWYLAYCR